MSALSISSIDDLASGAQKLATINNSLCREASELALNGNICILLEVTYEVRRSRSIR